MINTDSSPEYSTTVAKAPVKMIASADNIPILSDIAETLGLKFKILKKEGEEYTIATTKGKPPHKAPIPKGKLFVSIDYPPKGDLSEFWNLFEQKKKELV